MAILVFHEECSVKKSNVQGVKSWSNSASGACNKLTTHCYYSSYGRVNFCLGRLSQCSSIDLVAMLL